MNAEKLARYPGFFGGGGGGGGGLDAVGGLGDRPLITLVVGRRLEGGGMGSLAMSFSQDVSGCSGQKLYHFHFARGYQKRGNTRGRYPLIVNQPFSFRYPKMAFFGMTGPFFGPSIEASLPLEVQDDIAIAVSRESGIPLGWVRSLLGHTKATKNSVYGVPVRSIGGQQCERNCDQD